jgi:zinc finger BED domain-containing protein 5/7/8/9
MELSQYNTRHWLSRGKVLQRVFEMRKEIELFLADKDPLLSQRLLETVWLIHLCYLVDIYNHVNDLNTSMQGHNETIISSNEKVNSFQSKLLLWKMKMEKGMIGAFPRLSSFLEDEEQTNLADVKDVFLEHMENLHMHLQNYFPENVANYSWIRNPFDVQAANVSEEPPGLQEQLIDMQSDQTLKDRFHLIGLSQFWVEQTREKPILANEALKILLPFPTTYLCEAGFSTLTTIKAGL